MTIKELNTARKPIVKIDKKLNKLAEKDVFPEKLEEANKILRLTGLPKAASDGSKQNGARNGKTVRLERS
jgi:hypothetical protein